LDDDKKPTKPETLNPNNSSGANSDSTNSGNASKDNDDDATRKIVEEKNIQKSRKKEIKRS
jgi:hypothetical protein